MWRRIGTPCFRHKPRSARTGRDAEVGEPVSACASWGKSQSAGGVTELYRLCKRSRILRYHRHHQDSFLSMAYELGLAKHGKIRHAEPTEQRKAIRDDRHRQGPRAPSCPWRMAMSPAQTRKTKVMSPPTSRNEERLLLARAHRTGGSTRGQHTNEADSELLRFGDMRRS